MRIENWVVVEKDKKYSGGVGYAGPVLEILGFPVGPYVRKTAEILVRQAKTVDPTLKLVIQEFRY